MQDHKSPNESFDIIVIGAGHASTSISAALGIAEARRQLKWKPKVNIKELIKDMISEEFSY